MKKIIIFALVACMMLTFCACGSNNEAADDADTTVADTTAKVTLPETEPVTDPVIETVFTVKVVDSEGNPVANVPVQVCDDSTCNNAMTDAEGNALFTTEHFDSVKDGFTCSLVICPTGYECEYVGDNKVYLEKGMTELEIVVTKAN